MAEETLQFETEVANLLSLVVNSLYSEKQIFLRELLSNASDACDRLRYLALTDAKLTEDDATLRIVLRPDTDAGTLTISDNGIGMDREGLVADLGTIARSGTSAFVNALSGDAAKDVSLIGQFGVGFYSAFMVADRVEVVSRRAGDTNAWKWVSSGKGDYSISEAEKDGRGTEITLFLNEDHREYLEPERLRHIVKTYSDHVALPIVLAGEEGEDTLNSASALWTRPRSEIEDAQYTEFYHHVGHAFDDPWLTLHFTVEGNVEYTGLLFVPSERPFDLFTPERDHQVKLYVKRVFITDKLEGLVPPWLRFLRGLIDSQDLPLNVSREMLQESPLIGHIRAAIVKRVLGELEKKAEKDTDAYAKFWENFGPVLKEGLYEAPEQRGALTGLLRFTSTEAEGLTSLSDYIGRMKDDQEAIYYMTGPSMETLRRSPQLEGFRARGVEVLLMADPVDEFWLPVVGEYDGKPLQSVTRAGADIGNIPLKDGESSSASAGDEKTDSLVALFKLTLGDAVKDVRGTDRLTDSPACLVAGEGDMDIHLERLMKQHQQLDTASKRILEINPGHPVIRRLAGMVGDDSAEERLKDGAFLLLDQARILDGEPVPDPAAFSARLATFMAAS